MTVPAEVFPELSLAQRDRLDYRRGQARRSRLLAATSTVVFLAVFGTVMVLSPGWSRVQDQFLDLGVARDSLPAIARGFWLNLRVLAVCAVLIVVVGLGVAALRTLRGPVFAPLRFLAAAYTDVFRGIPLIVLLYVVGFGLPGLRLQGVPTSPVVLGGVALVLTYGAYVAEVFRAEDRDQAHVLLQRHEVVEQRGRDPANGLGKDDLAHRLAVGQAQGPRGHPLARVHRLDAGAEHLGDIRTVGQHQRHAAEHHR